ncbi:EAL domain-containing protein [Pseudoalteromonas sp. BSi20495]|uniref:EAL domain-containing response regulator n=1 Tax=Pseudoalteromonas sp. BSi20495 TaxID=386429 RepID=UPI0002315B14|nr:EAL domain-containing protein [Pseudoalteromonas sp. BSi20495]GAA78810.1 diguanylate cyclase/phosphodiesterase with PAS/PAC sensor(s) [Pseudoalteromonas sp. BSi20495]
MKKMVPNILVVDDSKAILIIMEAILSELDMSEKVVTCLSAAEALEKVANDINRFDAVFTDLNMPEMDGMELIRHLGALNYQGGIIIVSEMDHKVISLAADLAKQHNAHLIGNIPKPVQLSQMRKLLTKVAKLNCHTLLRESLISKSELIKALKNDEVTPFYQPKVNAINNKIESVEILARIVSSKDGSIILPNRFISLAEQYNLINQITFSLFEKATSEFSNIKAQLGHDFKMAFNLSPIQLDDLNCPNKLLLILELNQLTPSNIIIEITEQHALSSLAQLETLNRLRMHGFGVSLDDFGVGFTNINQLRNLPFTEIKIDRSLISNIETDLFSQVIVSSLVNITNKEHLDLVAEGVERPEELAYLKHYKKDLTIQGFLYSSPKPKNEFIDWAKNWLRTDGSPA